MFKKRGKKGKRRRNIREPTSDVMEEGETNTKSLAEIKFLQKYRAEKTRGIKAGIEEEEEEEEDEVEEKPQEHFLGAYQQGMTEGTDDKEDKYMQQYIEEELRKRQRASAPKVEGDERKKRQLDETEEMLKKINEEGKLANTRGEENWSAGITEIALPISVKLRNIEATERAKQKLLGREVDDDESEKSKKRKKRSSDEAAKGNYSANFNMHQRDYAKRMKEKRDRETRAGPEKPKQSKPYSGGDRVKTATDDHVIAKFIKRNNYRRN
ncbi:hypothetical protein AAMO2058_000132400 [Amorphochlora amoebiformis]|uniref:Uncharacterized protein n=1 Tax=Amorphochlora amoebiformis TaxID=1561963 RepID=A0A7S0DTK9_9EUKA